jgi:hypothetical protein
MSKPKDKIHAHAAPKEIETPEQAPPDEPKTVKYLVLSPVNHHRRFEIGEKFDVTGLTEKQIKRLVDGKAIKVIEE